ICEEKAVHPELEELCGEIIAAQSSEIEEMQSWLQDWYGITYAPQMKPGAAKMMQRLAQLSGAEFEIEFMEMMIKHHEKAITEAMKCERRAFHAELKQLCASIIETQSEEIEQMQEWLCEWYGECQ
ncbi:MAG: DUF305 domain-containing protein, partial [Chthoniobacteraceae bacterium]